MIGEKSELVIDYDQDGDVKGNDGGASEIQAMKPRRVRNESEIDLCQKTKWDGKEDQKSVQGF